MSSFRNRDVTESAVLGIARDEALGPGDRVSAPRYGWGLVLAVAKGSLDLDVRGLTWQIGEEWAVWDPGNGATSIRSWEETRVLQFAAEFPHLRQPQLFRVQGLFRELLGRLAELGGIYDEPFDRALLTVLRDELSRAWPLPLTPPWPRGAWLEAAAVVLRSVGPDEAPIDWLAGQLGMARKSLDRRFAQDTGTLPAYWRRQARVIEATRLMSQGFRVEAVVEMVGFRSRNALNEAFQAQFGVSPGKLYRAFFRA